MTILEQILAGLQQKFTGVDTAILTRIATKKAEGVTDETKVNSIVEGISFSDVLNSYGDFRAGDASKTAVSNYEKKHNLKDGKPIETTTTIKTEENKDDVPAWAQALIDSNKNLSDKLTQLETEKAQATRSQQILAKAKEYGIPENYAKRCAIKDDEDLDAYFKDLKQEFANDGFKGVTPPESAEEKIEKESESIAKMIDEGTKTIVEQKQELIMSAGFKYDLVPPVEQEERYDVQTGIRRRGPFKLDTQNLVVGSFLPGFTPICADLKNKFAYAVINVRVAEAYTTGGEALSIKVAKNSLAYVGMFVGNGKKGAEVTAIDKSNANYDVLTIKAAFGENIAKDAVLFNAVAVDGLKQKHVANSALYNRTKVEDGITLVSLLRTAAEIEPSKLVMPFSENDKANMKGWFEFNE